MYNDGNAKNILKEVENIRKDNMQYSKSAWEKELIDKVRDKTNLLDLEAYCGKFSEIEHSKINDITTFINSIYLYDDKLTLIFNSGDKSVTINDILLSEIEANNTESEGLFIDKVGLPNKKSEKRLK